MNASNCLQLIRSSANDSLGWLTARIAGLSFRASSSTTCRTTTASRSFASSMAPATNLSSSERSARTSTREQRLRALDHRNDDDALLRHFEPAGFVGGEVDAHLRSVGNEDVLVDDRAADDGALADVHAAEQD